MDLTALYPKLIATTTPVPHVFSFPDSFVKGHESQIERVARADIEEVNLVFDQEIFFLAVRYGDGRISSGYLHADDEHAALWFAATVVGLSPTHTVAVWSNNGIIYISALPKKGATNV